ncbi:unnamed protein product [Clonostachys chloroleuca]|uniref:Uncharacterized protein n=1 Tax=Clonostachys chloroleuca TaxID=1926264 RepID=A0AA35QDA3_9HYPO|nr:unnamed protein product [Clonostachys chloroleuca]
MVGRGRGLEAPVRDALQEDARLEDEVGGREEPVTRSVGDSTGSSGSSDNEQRTASSSRTPEVSDETMENLGAGVEALAVVENVGYKGLVPVNGRPEDRFKWEHVEPTRLTTWFIASWSDRDIEDCRIVSIQSLFEHCLGAETLPSRSFIMSNINRLTWEFAIDTDTEREKGGPRPPYPLAQPNHEDEEPCEV